MTLLIGNESTKRNKRNTALLLLFVFVSWGLECRKTQCLAQKPSGLRRVVFYYYYLSTSSNMTTTYVGRYLNYSVGGNDTTFTFWGR